jgi:polyisoprenoid-binding protein YceI
MKRIFLVLPIALLTLVTSCGSNAETETHEEAVVAENVESKDYAVSTTESLVNWSAEGVGHGHNGTIGIQSGSFTMNNDKIEAGEITINMPSLLVTDIEDSLENAKLYGHLTTEDFFNVTAFPTATLTIKDGSDMNNVVANMTIKDITEEVTFALSTTDNDGKLTLTSKLSIDRTKYGIIYSSGNFFEDLGDYLVEDNFNLDITIITE